MTAVAGLDMHGLEPQKTVPWNLSPVQLYERALERGEGLLGNVGADNEASRHHDIEVSPQGLTLWGT